MLTSFTPKRMARVRMGLLSLLVLGALTGCGAPTARMSVTAPALQAQEASDTQLLGEIVRTAPQRVGQTVTLAAPNPSLLRCPLSTTGEAEALLRDETGARLLVLGPLPPALKEAEKQTAVVRTAFVTGVVWQREDDTCALRLVDARMVVGMPGSLGVRLDLWRALAAPQLPGLPVQVQEIEQLQVAGNVCEFRARALEFEGRGARPVLLSGRFEIARRLLSQLRRLRP